MTGDMIAEKQNDDFAQAFEKLRVSGEGLAGITPKEFTPVGIRTDVKDSGPFYHGTKADFKVGDLIGAGFETNYDEKIKANFVYFTALKEVAIMVSESVPGEGKGKVYIVEPTGSMDDDPNLTDKKFPGNPTRSYRSREPLRVIRELTGFEGFFSPEALEKKRKIADSAKKLNLEAIND